MTTPTLTNENLLFKGRYDELLPEERVTIKVYDNCIKIVGVNGMETKNTGDFVAAVEEHKPGYPTGSRCTGYIYKRPAALMPHLFDFAILL